MIGEFSKYFSFIAVLTFFRMSFLVKPIIKSDILDMEINDIIKNEKKINDFIVANFDKMSTQDENPIFPYRVNYIGKSSSFTFCKVPITKLWALKSDSSFSFF